MKLVVACGDPPRPVCLLLVCMAPLLRGLAGGRGRGSSVKMATVLQKTLSVHPPTLVFWRTLCLCCCDISLITLLHPSLHLSLTG